MYCKFSIRHLSACAETGTIDFFVYYIKYKLQTLCVLTCYYIRIIDVCYFL